MFGAFSSCPPHAMLLVSTQATLLQSLLYQQLLKSTSGVMIPAARVTARLPVSLVQVHAATHSVESASGFV